MWMIMRARGISVLGDFLACLLSLCLCSCALEQKGLIGAVASFGSNLNLNWAHCKKAAPPLLYCVLRTAALRSNWTVGASP